MRASRAAKEIFHDLPRGSKDVVGEWLALGHDLRGAILNSNVLGAGAPVSPQAARREQSRVMGYRESAEHESAHAVATQALGLNVESAKIAGDNSGSCEYVKGTKLQNAIVIMAPELWIDRFRKDAFPYGPTGLKADHRALADINDTVILRHAMDHCMAILKQNRALVLATADQIERYGFILAPWI